MALGSVPLDRINAEAREVRFTRVLLTLLAGMLFGFGWVAARTCTTVWAAAAWSVTAVRVGWREGMAGRGREGS